MSECLRIDLGKKSNAPLTCGEKPAKCEKWKVVSTYLRIVAFKFIYMF